MIEHKPGYIRDGKLDSFCGRIILYDGYMLFHNGISADHNYLLRAFAARYRYDKNEVINKAIRLYFRKEENRIVISGVRQIDDDDLERQLSAYKLLIENELR